MTQYQLPLDPTLLQRLVTSSDDQLAHFVVVDALVITVREGGRLRARSALIARQTVGMVY